MMSVKIAEAIGAAVAAIEAEADLNGTLDIASDYATELMAALGADPIEDGTGGAVRDATQALAYLMAIVNLTAVSELVSAKKEFSEH